METRSKSLPPKCPLCSDKFPLNSLSSQDLERFLSVLESHIPEITGLLNDFSGEGNTTALCGQCDVLLKEAARLHLLIETLNSQLNSIILSIRAKVVEKSLQIKDDEEQENILPLNKEFQHIQSPTVAIKQEDNDDYSPTDSSAFEFPNCPNTDEHISSSSPESSVDDYESDSYQPPSKSRRKATRKTTGNKSKSCNKVSTPKMSKKRSTTQEFLEDDPNSSKKHRRYFLCDLCSIYFKRKEDKFLHYESFHFKGASEDVQSGCRLYSRICGKSSMTPGDLSRHNETFHASSLKFICPSCTPHRKFTSFDLLKGHQPIHDDSLTSFPCSLCLTSPLTFDTPLLLDNHILRVHAHLLNTSARFPLELHINRTNPECENNNSRGKQPTLCRWCGFKARGLIGLRTHERQTHPEQFTFICTECQSTFAEESHRLTCQETHKDSPPFNCFVCNLTCPTGPDLKEHLASKHTFGGIKCNACPDAPISSTKRYACALRLKTHKAFQHGGEWAHKCPICHKGFQSPSYVQDHLRSAHKHLNDPLIPDPHKCSHCGLQFTTNKSLHIHVQRDHKGQTFICEECGKPFGSKTTLWTHKKIHTGIKDHICHICGKPFNKTFSLKVHLRTHTGEKPHTCHICHKSFARTTVLAIHLRTHTGEKPYVCHICSKGFAQRTPMLKHFAQHKKQGTWQDEPLHLT